MTDPRTYVVLVEDTVDSHFGDTAFVLLGYYDATDPAAAAFAARADHQTIADLVVVPAGWWKTR